MRERENLFLPLSNCPSSPLVNMELDTWTPATLTEIGRPSLVLLNDLALAKTLVGMCTLRKDYFRTVSEWFNCTALEDEEDIRLFDNFAANGLSSYIRSPPVGQFARGKKNLNRRIGYCCLTLGNRVAVCTIQSLRCSHH